MGMRHSGPKGALPRGERGSVAPEGAGFTSARSHGLRRGLTSVALRAWQRRGGVAQIGIFDETMCKLQSHSFAMGYGSCRPVPGLGSQENAGL